MNDDFYRANKNGLYLYFVGAVITIVSGKLLHPFSFPVRAAGGILLLAVYLIMV